MMKRVSRDVDSSPFFGVKRRRTEPFDLAISTLMSLGVETPNQVFHNLKCYLAEPDHQDYFFQQGGFTKLCSLLSLTTDREKQASMLDVIFTLTAAHGHDLFEPKNIQHLEQLIADTDDVARSQAKHILLDLLQNNTCPALALSSATIVSLFQLREQADQLAEDDFLKVIHKLSKNESNYSGIREAGGIRFLVQSLDQLSLRQKALTL